MREYIIVSIFTLFYTTAFAQDKTIEKTIITGRYVERVAIDTLTCRYVTDTLWLKAGKNSSAFYSQNQFFRDSLLSTPNGRMKFMQLVTKLVSEGRQSTLQSNTGEYVYQGYPDNGHTTTRCSILADQIEVVEKRELPQWELIDSCRIIEGYECRLAIAPFRGRMWSAWYTTDIPINSGPWKLWGLPGLILEANDINKHYCYRIVNLRQTDSDEVICFNMRRFNYTPADRIKYLRRLGDYMFVMTTAESVRLTTGNEAVAKIFDSEQKTAQYDFRERDYK